MTVSIPGELEDALAARASERHTSVQSLVCQALEWYLRMDIDLLDELEAWEEVRDEALRIAERSEP